MKKIIRPIIALSLAANSIMAWSYYPNTSYGSQYTPYRNWQSSYTQPYQGYQNYQNYQNYPGYQQGCPAPSGPSTSSMPQEQPSARAGSFEQQYNNLIIMFTKDNCPFCIYMKPKIQEAEMEFGDKIKFLYVDISQNPQYAAQYGFSTVPHIVYFKNGRQLDAHGSGNKTITAEQVKQRIKNLFN